MTADVAAPHYSGHLDLVARSTNNLGGSLSGARDAAAKPSGRIEVYGRKMDVFVRNLRAGAPTGSARRP